MSSTGYKRSTNFSHQKLSAMRAALRAVVPNDAIMVTFGSYARREASEESDLDYSLLLSSDQQIITHEDYKAIKKTIFGVVAKEPAVDGAFAGSVTQLSLVTNLGGNADVNENITRRMLLLLEGDWLTNELAFNVLRRTLIERYVEATHKDHQLALFLLNDIIRYWRTMTVDYAYKTSESVNPKPKAVRNLKLVFSRKLMYAGGLFAVGTTADRTSQDKVETLDRLFRMPVVSRLRSICGDSHMTLALQMYDAFLDAMADPKLRSRLNSLGDEYRDDTAFRSIKIEAHRFARELMSAFEHTFHSTHPIRRAALF